MRRCIIFDWLRWWLRFDVLRDGRRCRRVGGLSLLLGTRQPWVTGSSRVHSGGEEMGTQVSTNSPTKSWLPQKYLNVTGSAWKSRTRSSYDSTRHISREKLRFHSESSLATEER